MIHGPGVDVPAEEAAGMAAALRLLAARNGGLPASLLERLRQFEQLASASRLVPGSKPSEPPIEVPRRTLADVTSLGASAVAEQLGCSPEYVRELCRSEAFGDGQQELIAGRWFINPAAVDDFQARRNR